MSSKTFYLRTEFIGCINHILFQNLNGKGKFQIYKSLPQKYADVTTCILASNNLSISIFYSNGFFTSCT